MLVVIESPNKIKKIKSFLKSAEIMATVGHFMDLPEDKMGVDLTSYTPTFVYTKNRDGSDKGGKVSAQLRKFAKGNDVYIATDPDREGYAIGTMAYNEIKSIAKTIHRLEIHEITKKGLDEAFKKAVPFDQTNHGSYDSFLGRRVGDRVVGYVLSPIAKAALKSKLTQIQGLQPGYKISVGRVQAPAVRLTVVREREIRDFKSSNFWVISISLDKTGTVFEAGHKNGNFTDENAAKAAFAAVSSANTAKILKVETKETKQNPKAPFSTVELQVTANSQLKIAPERAMAIAQELFEHGLISYHRTDTVRIADEFIKEIRDHVTGSMGPAYLPPTPNQFTSKNSQADAHEAIRPTHMHALGDISKIISGEGLGSDHERVYALIYKRTVASQMAPAVYDSTSVDIECGGEPFKANGRVLKFEGFLSLYNEAKDDEDQGEGDQKLPVLTDNENVAKVGQKNDTRQTKPPGRYTEGSLVKALEKHGIGRPSTYASIMGTIKARSYIQIVKGKIHATQVGEVLYDYLAVEHPWVIDLDLTKRMEEYLDQVENAKANWISFVKGVHSKMNFAQPSGGGSGNGAPTEGQLRYAKTLSEKNGIEIPAEAMAGFAAMSEWLKSVSGVDLNGQNNPKSGSASKAHEEIGKCPKCKKSVFENRKSFYCSGYFDKSCNFSLWKDRLKKLGKDEITQAQMKQLLGMKEVDISGFKTEDGATIKCKCLLKEDAKFGWGVQAKKPPPTKMAA